MWGEQLAAELETIRRGSSGAKQEATNSCLEQQSKDVGNFGIDRVYFVVVSMALYVGVTLHRGKWADTNGFAHHHAGSHC